LNLYDPASQPVTLAGLAGGRPDPRFFNFPDGSAGVLLETTGAFYRLTQNPNPTAPVGLWPSSAVPSDPASSDPSAVELGVRFRSDADGYVAGVRFYKGAGNDGPHTGSLWSSSGVLLATASFSGESASGWQTVAFSAPVRVSAGATYVASYHTESGHYMADWGYFSSSGRDSGVLHAPAGPNGVFAYGGGGAFPDGSYMSTNYWVDVLFAAA